MTSSKPKKWGKRLVVLAGAAAVYLWDEVIFGAPVLGVSAWIGSWPAFLIMAPAYGLLDFFLGTLALRAYERRVQSCGKESRVAHWLQSYAEGGDEIAQKLGNRLTRHASRAFVGVFFLFSSWQGGAIVTTLAFRYAGHQRNLKQIMVGAAVIYAVTFVGQYAGISALIF